MVDYTLQAEKKVNGFTRFNPRRKLFFEGESPMDALTRAVRYDEEEENTHFEKNLHECEVRWKKYTVL